MDNTGKWDISDVHKCVDIAASIVARDMKARPVSEKDGIWRFDMALRNYFGGAHYRPREFWLEVERQARAKNAGKDTWDSAGYGIVASFASTTAAYATPGFAEARSKYMT